MLKKIVFPILFFTLLNPLISTSFADIYSYVDENGVTHLTNKFVPGAKTVMRTSSLNESHIDGTAIENVKELLNQPRFSHTATMHRTFDVFQGNYPVPLEMRLEQLRARGLYVSGAYPIRNHNYPTDKTRFYINEANFNLYKPYIELVSAQVGIDPAFVHAVIAAESAFHIKARSHVGAMGLMQLMPATARRFGVIDAYDPLQNIRGGATYLKWLLKRFNNVELAIAGYNAGEGAVEKYNYKIPPYKETQNYVPKVMRYYLKYAKELYGRSPLHF